MISQPVPLSILSRPVYEPIGPGQTSKGDIAIQYPIHAPKNESKDEDEDEDKGKGHEPKTPDRRTASLAKVVSSLIFFLFHSTFVLSENMCFGKILLSSRAHPKQN